MKFPRSSKYGSRKTTRGGITYQSTLEGDYADNLTWKLKAGEITKIERQVRIRLVVNGKLICCYDVDFRVTLPDGRVQYIEVKGYETELFKTKWKLARALYPDWEWVMVRKNR